MSEQVFSHKPVLLDECIEALAIRPEGVYLDGTLGRAGHSREIVRRLTTGRLICVDRDQAALDAAEERLAPWRERVTLVHSNFCALDAILDGLGLDGVDGMLFDLGVSSPQLDDASRGFSYRTDAPLDMRMDQTDTLTARAVVNEWPQEELRRILWQYGEERYAPAVAGAIVRARDKRPIETTLELVEVVKGAMPPAALREKQHPAKRTFQAIRIAVNDELGSVDRMVWEAVPRLNPGGRLAVISFHSLEDRIVKNALAAFAKGCTCPPDFPVCVCGKKPQVKLVNKKPIVSGAAELEENPRAPQRQAPGSGKTVEAPNLPKRLEWTDSWQLPSSAEADTRITAAYPMTRMMAPRRGSSSGRRFFGPGPMVRPRERAVVRPRVRVREAGLVSPFAVVGFLAVGVFAVLLLFSYVQLTTISQQVVELRNEMTALQSEEAKLRTAYELSYDLSSIEETMTASGAMVRPQNGQVVYVDLSEPDTVTFFNQGRGGRWTGRHV